jgi:hypothetical protein
VGALLASLALGVVAPCAFAQDRERTNCRDLVSSERPTDIDLEQAKRAAEKAQASLDELERQRAAAHDTLEAALGRSPSQPGELEAAKSGFDAAVRARDAALLELEAKQRAFACTEVAYDDARTFVHGFALGFSAARAADDTRYLGLSARYVHPYGPARSLELALEVNRLERGTPARQDESDEHELLVALVPRFSFGTNGAAFVIGGGFALLPDEDEVAVLGELGIDFRVNYRCGADSESCAGLWLNLKPFVQPLLPFDGSPVAFLFGVQVGGGGRWGRVGP